ncbi:hypothetical protein HNQ88_000898 [Aureibacter tunicatorum]|uniref:Carboxypeptidase-like regulatory domain-containing protein n=2 Tax=Aureibacter tunicatorum TaxID=866807 RepID=A0AAE3XK64_9BACT|nr:hypothetical protein [Aureibacter tunicatorum]
MFALSLYECWSQETILLTAKVIDKNTKEPIPFANVYVEKDPLYGVESSPDGEVALLLPKEWSSATISVSSIGYQIQNFDCKTPFSSMVFELEEDVTKLDAVVFKAGENPAYNIIRKASKQRGQITEKGVNSYTSTSLNSIDLSMDPAKAKKLKFIHDAAEFVAKNDSSTCNLIPLVHCEAIMNNYAKGEKRKSKPVNEQFKAIGIDRSDEIVRIITESPFHSGDLNDNNIMLLDKGIPSPLSSFWRVNYKLWLMDSLNHQGRETYLIEVEPRIKGSLAFEGQLWIDKEDNALVKADLELAKSANVNFISQMNVVQNMERQPSGIWTKKYFHIQYNVSEFFDGFPAVLLDYKYHYNDYKLQAEIASSVFEKRFEIKTEDENNIDPEEWETAKSEYINYDSLKPISNQTFQMIDSINEIKSVKRFTNLLRFGMNAYTNGKNIAWGKHQDAIAYNNIEGFRLGLGGRINTSDRKLLLIPNIAYGFDDQKWKHDVKMYYNINPEKAHYIGFETMNELMPLGLLELETGVNPFARSLARWGDLQSKNPYYRQLYRFTWSTFHTSNLRLQMDLSKDDLKIWNYDTRQKNINENTNKILGIDAPLQTYEARLKLMYTKHDKILLNKNNELKLVPPLNKPVFETSISAGYFQDLNANNSWVPYGKASFKARQMFIPLLGIGSFSYWINGGYTFTEAPYQLLHIHQGAESILAVDGTIRGMNEFEFVSDYYLETRLEHYFEGRLASAIPGLRQLNRWTGARFVLFSDIVWGGMTEKNKRYNAQLLGTPVVGDDGIQRFNTLDPSMPFVGLGFGIENIFRFFRVDVSRRMNYNEVSYSTNPWSIRLSAKIKF